MQDPSGNMVWAKSFGGAGTDVGYSVAVDSDKNVYTTGSFQGVMFVTKMDPSGNPVWTKSFGGAGKNVGYSVAVGSDNNVYVTGSFRGTVDFDPDPDNIVNLTSNNDSLDVFMMKMDPLGNLVWAKSFGGLGHDEGFSVAVDSSDNDSPDNVYVTGRFQRTANFTPGTGTTNLISYRGSWDGFVAKMDSLGNLVWAKSFGNSKPEPKDHLNDYGTSVAVDSSGNVYVTGWFGGKLEFHDGADTATLNPLRNPSVDVHCCGHRSGRPDVFVTKMDPLGNLVWAKSFGGIYEDMGFSVAVDSENNVYVTGSFEGTVDFDPDPANFVGLTSNNDSLDVFVTKMDPLGNLVWAKSFGDATEDKGFSVAVDSENNVYVTGNFRGTVEFDPDPANFVGLTSNNDSLDVFVTKMDPSGNLVWAKSFGDTTEDKGISVAVDSSDNVYVTGNFRGTLDFDSDEEGIPELTSNDSQDVFVIKYGPPVLPDPPDAPTGLKASRMLGGVALEWTAPEGAEVTDYRVEGRKAGDDEAWKVFDDGFSAATSASVEIELGEWMFRVSATVLDEDRVADVDEGVGWSDWSEVEDFLLWPDPPGAPTGLKASPRVDGVALEWTAPEGAEVTDYRVEYREADAGGAEAWQVFDDGFSAETSAFVKIEPGEWVFQVSATTLDEGLVADVDDGSFGEGVSAYGQRVESDPIGPAEVPQAPTITNVELGDQDEAPGQADVDWESTGDGGLPLCAARAEITSTRATDSAPAEVSETTAGICATAVSAGNFHTCAVTLDGDVWCWGANNSGQIGTGTTSDDPVLGPQQVKTPVSVEFTEVSAGGDYHTCAVTTDGGVWCWGAGGLFVGNGTSGDDVLTPVKAKIPESVVVTGISAGSYHTCAVTADGGVWCWGSNGVGQVGNGTQVGPVLEPEKVTALVGYNVTGITAGYAHTCAMTADGGVWCWGHNDYGQVGNRTQIGPVLVPSKVTALDVPQLEVAADAALKDGYNVTEIAAGGYHTCAVTADGGVWCWGANWGGQVGNGTQVGPVLEPEKVTELDGYNVTGISADPHTCAVTADGGVWCWGDNGSGQIGDGTQVGPVLDPEKVTALDGYNVTEIAAGGGHTCAVTADGGVWCWGNNNKGQIGYGTTSFACCVERVEGWHRIEESAGAVVVSGLGYGEYTVQVQVSNAVGWSDWSEGEYFLVLPDPPGAPTGLKASPRVDGVALEWTAPVGVEVTDYRVEYREADAGGAAAWEVFDDGFSAATSAFVEVGPGEWVFWVSATVLDEDLVADVDDGSFGEGVSAYGQRVESDPIGPAEVPQAPTITDVELGEQEGTPGEAYVEWSSAGDGGLPICAARVEITSTRATDSAPAEVSETTVRFCSTAVSAGGHHTCAVAGGDVWCWGRNNYGQRAGFEVSDAPVITVDVTAVSAGGYHTCAVAGGDVWCWGRNNYGQIGNGDEGSRVSTPVNVEILEPGGGQVDVTAVSAGAAYTCAVAGGDVWCWGANTYGQAGREPGVSQGPAKVLEPEKVAALDRYNVIDISAAGLDVSGGYLGGHTCALTADGDVWCWGANYSGQIGNGDEGSPVSTPVKVEILELGGGQVDVTAVSAGGSHTCALAGGDVWCWGNNDYGQVRTGDEGSLVLTPVKVEILELGGGQVDVTAVSAGGSHTCALAGGDVWCWGINRHGQTGPLNTWNVPTPVKVEILEPSGDQVDVTAVSAGRIHTCALAGVDVWCWGANAYGQAGGEGGPGSIAAPEKVVVVETYWFDGSGGRWPVSELEYGEYTVQVQVRNAVGWSDPSTPPWSFERPVQPPDPPDFVAVPWEMGVKVTWEPSRIYGSPVSGYTVIVSGVEEVFELEVAADAALEAVFDGLVSGSVYRVVIAAKSEAGDKFEGVQGREELFEFSGKDVSTHVFPGAPTPVEAVPGDGRVDLSWVASDIRDDAGTVGYAVRYRSAACTVAPDCYETLHFATVGSESATATGLTNGEEYEFEIRAQRLSSHPMLLASTFGGPENLIFGCPECGYVEGQGPLLPVGDRHGWTFEGVQGRKVKIWLEGDISWPTIQLFGPSGELLFERYLGDYGEDGGDEVSVELCATGTHTLTVLADDIDSADYMVGVEGSLHPIVDEQSRVADSCEEIQISESGSLAVGSPVEGSLTPGERQRWTFEGMAGTSVNLGLLNTENFEPGVWVFDPMGELVGDDRLLWWNARPLDLCATGTYTISVGVYYDTQYDEYYWEEGPGDYELALLDVTDPDVGNSCEGPQVSDWVSSGRVTPYTTSGAPGITSASPAATQQVTVSWTAPADNGGSAITGYTVTANPAGSSTTCTTVSTDTEPLSCTVDNLVNGTAYTFTVVATNAAGDSEADTSDPVTPRTVPGPPVITSASPAATQQVTVSWTAPADNGGSAITGYTVSANSGGATCTTVSTDTDPLSCTVDGLVNGTAYTFTVVATNAAGDSEADTSDPVTPRTVPDAPPSVKASPENLGAEVSWQEPDENGSAITDYTVTATPADPANPAGSCTTVSTDTDPLSCTVGNLVNGAAYTFAVVALNAAGNSQAATSAAATVTPRTTPGRPTAVIAEVDDGKVTVGWKAPGNSGGSAITGYTVTATLVDSSVVVSTCTTVSTDTDPLSCTVDNLVNATEYTFSVVATNAAGDSDGSAEPRVTPRTVPGPPGITSASPAATQQVTVSWTAPADNGGSAITGYTVSANPAGSSTTCTTVSTDTDPLSCTVDNLDNGTAYTFTVVATNAAGDSEADTSDPVTPRTVPGPPGITSASPAATQQVTVSWTAPADNGGSAITGYTVSANSGGATCTTVSTDTDPLSCTVGNLVNGTAYTFSVVATNAAGNSELDTSAAVTPRTVPGAPVITSASPAATQQVTVSWTAPADGGSAITGYTVSANPAGSSTTCTTVSTDTDPLSCTVGNLDNGTAYTFTVVATNAAGNSQAAPSTSVTPRTTPDVPTGLVGLVGDGEVLLGWTAPVDDGGDTVVDYVVEYSTGDEAKWVTIVDGTSAATTLGWAGASNGVDYTFRVSAVNAAGAGAASEPSAELSPFGVPDSPASVVASGADASAVVAWSMPDFDGGSPVTGYRVEYSPYPVETWTVAAADTASVDRSLVLEGLTNGSVYVFRVSAINAAGVGDTTIGSAQANPRTTASAPTGTAAVATDATVALSWSPPLTNGGSAVTGYEVAYRSETSGEWTILDVAADATTAVVDGLTNGVGYVLRVRAVTDVGDGDWSATTSAIPVTAPSAPPGIAVAAGDTTVTVSWSTPTSNGGSPIVDYQLESSSDAGTTWVAVTDDASTANSAAITGLVNDTAYVFRVRAVSDVGTSSWSLTSAAVTPVAAAPTPVTVTVGYSEDVWAGILRSLADGETPEAFQARAIATAATLTGRATDAGVLPMLRPAPFTGEAQSVTTVYAGADIDTLNAAAAAVGFSTTETQYAATYLLVFITDLTAWTETQLGNWSDYLTTP